MKMIGLVLLICFFCSCAYTQDETLILLTYYPAPYGMYARVGVGANIQFSDPDEYRTVLKIQDDARSSSSGTALLAVGSTTDSQNSAIFASQPGITGDEAYGIKTRISGAAGTGDIYGIDNTASTGGFGTVYGINNSVSTNNTGQIYGIKTTSTSNATSESISTIQGVYIDSNITNSNNEAAVSGLRAVANSAGGGNVTGVYGSATGSGSGIKYGVYAAASGGSGTKYGIYSTVSGSGTTWAGYFSGRVGTSNAQTDAAKHIFDIAELIPCASDVEYGDVVVINPDKDREVIRCTEENQSTAGIISESPQFCFGDREKAREMEPEKNWNFLALAGQVYCKADASYGEINRGDLLTTSPTPGHAMKADNPKIGTIVGKALEPLKEGKGKILVLVCLM